MFHTKRPKTPPFDPEGKTPVIRGSICTGERVAGYRDRASGRFTEIMPVCTESDLLRFLNEYGFKREDLKYEW